MLHEDAAAFALGALDRGEAEAFELHLPDCPACEDALAELQAAAVSLAFAIDLPAPRPELRARVLDAGAPVIALHHRRRPQLVAVAAALAACAAVAVALHPWASAGGPGGMRRYTAQGARASLLVGSDGEAVLTVRRLPPAPPGKVYEVWVISSGVTLPAGLMRGAVVALTRPVPRGAAVAVSVEPTGGSRRPTGPLLVRAETT